MRHGRRFQRASGTDIDETMQFVGRCNARGAGLRRAHPTNWDPL